MKVPELIQQEKVKASNPGQFFEAESEDRIILGDCLDSDMGHAQCVASDFEETARLGVFPPSDTLTAPPTELITSIDEMEPVIAPAVPASTKRVPTALPPLPPMPSPLLCPRRTFLACLILASKFLQDRSYSNKAWAKLAGLPPREIGRCERAVGEALEWRLWVGKAPSTPAVGTHRAVARCRSEGTLSLPTCAFPTSAAPAAQYAPRLPAVQSPTYSVSSGLRRSATMPELGSEGESASLAAATYSSCDAWVASSASLAANLYSAESEMDNSPSMHSGPQAGPIDTLPPSQMGSIFAFIPSPPVSTPTLSYSPMSTASSASSDDGERTVQFSSFVETPEYRSGCPMDKSTGRLPGLPYVLGRPFAPIKLVAMEPKPLDAFIRLPPLSEGASNPAFMEHSAQVMPPYRGVGIVGVGDSVSAYNSYYANWSVSG